MLPIYPIFTYNQGLTPGVFQVTITCHTFGNFFTPTTELKNIIIEYDIEYWHFTHSQVRQNSKLYFPWSYVQNPQQARHSEVNKCNQSKPKAFLGVSRALGCNTGKSPFPHVPIFLRVLGAIFPSGHPKKCCHVPSCSDPSVKGAAVSVTLTGHLSVTAAESTSERALICNAVLLSDNGISVAGNKYLCSNTCACSLGVANIIGIL